ncbi:MAG: HAD-IB family hydrolase [Dehalococcoidia bacterium]|nr:MAG: HAD-IB family hydrolase [Dehalococcoidia bacterium]
MEKTAAFFDFDGTLFQGHIWQGVVRHHITYKQKLASVSTYLGTHIPLWLMSKCKLLSEEYYKRKWAEDLSTTLGGLEEKEGLKIFRWITDNYVTKSLRQDIIALLQQHKEQGHIVILLSATFNDLLQIIGKKVGVLHTVGTKLEVIKDKYTGKIVEPLCLGANKAKLLKEFISQAQLNIDFPSSFAYGDSIFDTTTLEMVGNPVAVYPDRKLLNLAQQRGWQIIGSPGSSPANKQAR